MRVYEKLLERHRKRRNPCREAWRRCRLEERRGICLVFWEVQRGAATRASVPRSDPVVNGPARTDPTSTASGTAASATATPAAMAWCARCLVFYCKRASFFSLSLCLCVSLRRRCKSWLGSSLSLFFSLKERKRERRERFFVFGFEKEVRGARGCENHVIVWKKSIIFSVLFCSSINMGIHSSFAIVVFFFFFLCYHLQQRYFSTKKKNLEEFHQTRLQWLFIKLFMYVLFNQVVWLI